MEATLSSEMRPLEDAGLAPSERSRFWTAAARAEVRRGREEVERWTKANSTTASSADHPTYQSNPNQTVTNCHQPTTNRNVPNIIKLNQTCMSSRSLCRWRTASLGALGMATPLICRDRPSSADTLQTRGSIADQYVQSQCSVRNKNGGWESDTI
eukprot:307826-Prorocentrum_minimum.AAC.7